MAESSYSATQAHIALIAIKRFKLEAAQLDAEEQLIHCVAREFRAGNIQYPELETIYLHQREYGLPCWFSKRWTPAGLPALANIRRAIRDAQPPDALKATTQIWSGSFPYQRGDVLPDKGICVVYVLFDHDTKPCYVGSTFSFRGRMSAHVRSGKRWASWQAHRCVDREQAFEVEDRFLQQYKPYLNKASRARRP
jgi:hypothetical protein